MDALSIGAAGPDLVSFVPCRLVSSPRIARGVAIVGFDTEWRPVDRSLLSVQFAVRGADGGLFSRVVYSPPTQSRLDHGWLADSLNGFLFDAGRLPVPVRGVKRVTLVAHYAAAELGMFENALRDFQIMQIGKAHHAELPRLVDDLDGSRMSIRIVDLFAYYKTSLEKIGLTVGLPKLDAQRDDLESLLLTNKSAFEAYAVRDAEIALVAFEQLRQSVLERWKVDVLLVPSLAAIASAVFRRHFLQVSPVPTKSEVVWVKKKLKAGWVNRPRTIVSYDGPPERRLMACRAYGGGRAEAFGRGLIRSRFDERDVVSLYPSAALLQPLPNASTKWRQVKTLDEVIDREGFGTFAFEFPGTQYFPSLPVTREGVKRLAFTTKGQTTCTFAEVRAARELGADVCVLDAWGFVPRDAERNHDLGRYVREFMDVKAGAAKGSLEYETAKLLLNALIGKLGERKRGSNLLPLERIARESGSPGLVGVLARSGVLRGALKAPPGVGRLWAPEWASLILGRSRAIMAPIVAKGALLVSTDAVFVPPDVDVNCSALQDLHSVGSGLEKKVEGDAVFIARSRLYAVLQDVNAVRDGANVLARDNNWAVVRVARHGTPESETQFAETVLACIAAGKDVAPSRQRPRLLTAEAAVREDGEINEEVLRIGHTSFEWDSKRRLLDRDVNPFRHFTGTKPYLTLGKIEAAEHQRQVGNGVARRHRERHSSEIRDAVLEQLERGVPVREVARSTGVPKSTVADIRRRLTAGVSPLP